MPNLTLSVPEDLLRRARSRAAREGTSVNRLVRAQLARYVDEDADVGDAWDAFLSLAQRNPGRSADGRRTWRRDELQRTDQQRERGTRA